MRSPSLALALAALLLAAGFSVAAPRPGKGGTTALSLEQYMLDDTDFLLVINFKQIVASPMFTKTVKPDVEKLLALAPVKKYTDGTGLNLLKDVERMIVIISPSCFATKEQREAGNRDDGPVFLFQGKFDQTKLEAKMDKLIKDDNRFASSSKEGKRTLYRIGQRHGPYAAVIDKSTVILCGRKDHVKELWAKADGKKKTKLKHAKVWAVQLKNYKPELAARAVGLESMYFGSSYSEMVDGMGNRKVTVKHTSLGDMGLSRLEVTATIKNELAGKLVLTGKDKASFAKLSPKIVEGLEQAKKEGRNRPVTSPIEQAMLAVLDKVKTTKNDTSVTFEGKVEGTTIQTFLAAILKELGR